MKSLDGTSLSLKTCALNVFLVTDSNLQGALTCVPIMVNNDVSFILTYLSASNNKTFLLKRPLISFFKDLDYVGGIIPPDAMPKKQLNRFIEIHLLVDVGSKKAIEVIFGD